MSPIIVDKEKKREKILAAALAIFAEKGFSSTRIEDIAKKADIGKGTIYEYFRNKEELFFALYENMYKKFKEVIFSDLNRKCSASEALGKIVASKLKAFEKWQEFSSVVLDFWSEHRRGKTIHLRFNELYQDSRNRIAEIINLGIKSREFRKVDPFVAASTIIAVLDGLMIQRVFEPETFSQRDIGKRIVDMILRGIRRQ